jgi:hypothetical protein
MSEWCRVKRLDPVTKVLEWVDQPFGFDEWAPCRLHDGRLFAEPADPLDANIRSMHEFGFTFPVGTDVRTSDTIENADGTVSIIAGEDQSRDTWATAVRIWGNKPKTATPWVPIVLWRWNAIAEDYVALPEQVVQIVYSRNEPIETPLRYSPAARSVSRDLYLLGPVGGPFDVQMGDTFTLDGGEAGVVLEVLSHQPQRIEARCQMDEGGVR